MVTVARRVMARQQEVWWPNGFSLRPILYLPTPTHADADARRGAGQTRREARHTSRVWHRASANSEYSLFGVYSTRVSGFWIDIDTSYTAPSLRNQAWRSHHHTHD